MWKALPFDDRFEVSDEGQVRSWALPGPGSARRETPLARAVHSNHGGYQVVMICRKQYRVHRLVLEAFVGPCPEGCNVDHIDGNRANNRLENLRYLDISENSAQGEQYGENNPKTKLTWELVREIRATPHIKQQDWADRLGVSQHAIHCIRKHKTWKEQ